MSYTGDPAFDAELGLAVATSGFDWGSWAGNLASDAGKLVLGAAERKLQAQNTPDGAIYEEGQPGVRRQAPAPGGAISINGTTLLIGLVLLVLVIEGGRGGK